MKLYIIVKKTLSAGLKAAQACHAMHAFTQAYPDITKEWEEHNNIVILQHDDPGDLGEVLEAMELALVRFYEPDLGGQLTAICVEPSARKHLTKLPLAA